jgi:hypothetical protein
MEGISYALTNFDTAVDNHVISRPIAYVEENGNDTTAKLANPNLPYKTLNAAINALKPNGGLVQMGVGIFAAPSGNSLYSNLSFRGAAIPQPNSSTPSGFLTGKGTIITGNFYQDYGASKIHGLSFRDFGIDGTKDYNGGAFNFTYTGQDAFTNLDFQNLQIIVPSGTGLNGIANASHGMSLEQISYSNFNNIRIWYGYHGMAVKTRHCSFNNIYCAGAESDSIILKDGITFVGSNPLPCEYNNFSNINLGKVTNNKTAGIFFDNYYGIKNINMSNIVGENVTNPILFNTSTGGLMREIIIDNATFSSGYGLGLNFVNQGKYGNITIQDLQINDHSGAHALVINPDMDSNSRLRVSSLRANNNFGGNGFLFNGNSFENIDIQDVQANKNSGAGYLFYNNNYVYIRGGIRGSGNIELANFGGAEGWWAPEKAYNTSKIATSYATVLKTQYLTTKTNNNTDYLMQTEIPASLFYKQYGATLEMYSAGTFANNNNNKGVQVWFDVIGVGTYYPFDSTQQAQNGGAWNMRSYITSYPTNYPNAVIKISTEFKSQHTGYKTVQYTGISGYLDAGLTMAYKVIGVGGAGNDIVQEQMIATCLNAN